MTKMNLICLPFAGGSKYSYRQYEDAASSLLNIVTLEYPGRGSRMREPLVTDINRLVEDVFGQLLPLLNGLKYALYGHSLGGVIGYLLTRRILGRKIHPPEHVFITGSGGPGTGQDEKKRYRLNKFEFVEEIRKLEGCPDEVLENDQLLDLFEPILRADFEVSETYVYEGAEPFDIPITVITGSREEVKEDDIRLWQKETIRAIDFRVMEGGHFFIQKRAPEILRLIETKLFPGIENP